jgi:plastocyanin
MVRSIARVLVVGSLLGASVALVPGVLAADHAVSIEGFAFSPGSLTVSVGDTVTWTNGDGANHTATADDGSFDTGTIASRASKSATFSTAGTFGYHCSIHRSMTATIVVGDAATAPQTDTVAASQVQAAGASTAVLALLIVGVSSMVLIGLGFARRCLSLSE